jgi:hypothetical protein
VIRTCDFLARAARVAKAVASQLASANDDVYGMSYCLAAIGGYL